MTAVRKRGHIGERNLLKQECRYGILQAERLQQAQFLGGLKIKLLKMRAAVRFNGRRTFNGVKHFSDVIAETLSKRIQLSALDRQAGGKFMAAVFDQQVAAMRKRIHQAQTSDAAAGAFCHIPVKREENGRQAVLFGDLRGDNTDDALMPTIIRQYKCRGILAVNADLLLSLLIDLLLGLLASSSPHKARRRWHQPARHLGRAEAQRRTKRWRCGLLHLSAARGHSRRYCW